MDQEILNAILKNTYSLAQFQHRVRILKSNLLKTFFGSNEADTALPPEDLEFLKSLPSGFYQKFNKDNVYKIFSDLESQNAKLPILTMHLTFEPDETTVNQIGMFARKTFPLPLLLDIKPEPALIAGCALVWKGIRKDYSLRQRIEEKKGEMLQSFQKFLR